MTRRIPGKASLAAEIGFSLPEQYNASRLLYDNLPAHAGRPAILCDAGSWSYRQLAAEASRIGNALLALGCIPGDRVLLYLDDVPRYPAAIMGTLRAGLVPVLINTLSTPELVRFYLEDSAASAVLVSEPYADLFNLATTADCACRQVIVDGFAGSHQLGWEVIEAASDELGEAATSAQDMAFWMYSSGSTGRPKGIVHCHRDAAYTAATYARHILEINQHDIFFSVPKIFFAYGFGNSVTFPMSVGACSLLMAGRPRADAIFDQIERYRPSLFFGLPTLYTSLMRDAKNDRRDLGSLRLCLSAAEILSEEITLAWQRRFGLRIIEGLGSTEMLHIYLANSATRQKQGSAGQLVPGFAVRLLDADGNDAADDDVGVMSVCGLSGMREYWQRADKNAQSIRGDWIVTGDIFQRDADGFYFFKGRADDLVKISGQWVYPLEVEQALAEHPKVSECCVMALPRADQRMTLRAWIVVSPGVSADAKLTRELQDYIKQTLLPHKYPRDVIYLDDLPRTGTDKLDRQALRNS